MAEGHRDTTNQPSTFARLGWFVTLWAAGVLSLTVVGLAIRWALKT